MVPPRLAALALMASVALLLVACGPPNRGEFTYVCTPDGETRPRYLLTKVDRADGLALGAVRDLVEEQWLTVGRPVPVDASALTWTAGDLSFVVERRSGDLRVLDRVRGGLRSRGECDRAAFVPAPETDAAGP